MNRKDVLKNNLLIARFMGIKEREMMFLFPKEQHKYIAEHENDRLNPKDEDCWDIDLKDLKYHSCWNWLMHVITAILGIASELDDMERYYIIIDQIPQIYHTYESVVNFIKWYNQQKEEK